MFDFFKVTPKKRSVNIRKKEGVVFSNPNKIKKTLFYLATIVLLMVFSYAIYLYQPLVLSLIRYQTTSDAQKTELKPIEPVSNEFSIQIPKILAKSEIIPNVSIYNPNEFLPVLSKNVVAQSSISSLPGSGKGKTTYVFAHSSQQNIGMVRNNAVFYLADKLVDGDVIYINYRDTIYMYRVYTKKIISPKEIEYLTFIDPDKEVLILQTCWPIGTNWKRLLIFAERV